MLRGHSFFNTAVQESALLVKHQLNLTSMLVQPTFTTCSANKNIFQIYNSRRTLTTVFGKIALVRFARSVTLNINVVGRESLS